MLPALDVQDAGAVVDALDRAAEANLTAAGRRGSVVDLPRSGQLLMTGDLHDNTRNLQRILHLAELKKSAEHHLVLHEFIHVVNRVNGMDLSILTLARIAALKL